MATTGDAFSWQPEGAAVTFWTPPDSVLGAAIAWLEDGQARDAALGGAAAVPVWAARAPEATPEPYAVVQYAVHDTRWIQGSASFLDAHRLELAIFATSAAETLAIASRLAPKMNYATLRVAPPRYTLTTLLEREDLAYQKGKGYGGGDVWCDTLRYRVEIGHDY